MHGRIGVKKESWYLQETQNGFYVVVYTEATNENFKNDNSEFSKWFRGEVTQLQGINLDTEVKMPKLVLDWTE
jgi:hypothetical protein